MQNMRERRICSVLDNAEIRDRKIQTHSLLDVQKLHCGSTGLIPSPVTHRSEASDAEDAYRHAADQTMDTILEDLEVIYADGAHKCRVSCILA